MKNTDINKISNEFFLINKILNISLVMKKLDLYAFFSRNEHIYIYIYSHIYSMYILCMYFMINNEKKNDKCMIDKYIWDKVSNIIKKQFNNKIIYDKKYLETENRFNTKELFR